jgi:hypothetical protein
LGDGYQVAGLTLHLTPEPTPASRHLRPDTRHWTPYFSGKLPRIPRHHTFQATADNPTSLTRFARATYIPIQTQAEPAA